jgi:hypothetical protein
MGLPCGVERWPVKTLSDLDALRVSFAAEATTVEALNQYAPHCEGGPDTGRTFPQEFRTFEVVARVTLVRREDDRDYHIVLSDPETASTMVAEVKDLSCAGAAQSPFSGTFSAAQGEFTALRAGRSDRDLEGMLVRVRGVGFFDFDHRQTGRSRNCMELHPILAIGEVR